MPWGVGPDLRRGRIAFWTKSDLDQLFSPTRASPYTPREPFVQAMVRDVMREYPHLLGV